MANPATHGFPADNSLAVLPPTVGQQALSSRTRRISASVRVLAWLIGTVLGRVHAVLAGSMLSQADGQHVPEMTAAAAAETPPFPHSPRRALHQKLPRPARSAALSHFLCSLPPPPTPHKPRQSSRLLRPQCTAPPAFVMPHPPPLLPVSCMQLKLLAHVLHAA